MKTNTKKHSRRNGGIALIWMAITLIVLILFVGLALDYAKVCLAAHQLQNAADAAALAGARIVRVSEPNARIQAQYIAGLNFTEGNSVILNLNTDNNLNGDIVIGRFYYDERGFVPLQNLPAGIGPDALKAVAKRTESEHGPIPLIFGPIANVNTTNVSRVAIAQALGGWGAGIIALDCYKSPGLSIGGAATDLTLIGGGIQVNSNADVAFYTNKNTKYVPVPEIINVNGGVDDKKLPAAILAVTNTGAPQMPDPLCPDAQCDGTVAGSDCLPVPAFGPVIQTETVRGSTDPCVPKTIGPGYYPGGIELLSSNETLHLEPGIYILDAIGANKGGLYVNAGNLFGEDVMLYITGGGKIDIQGGGTIVLNQNNEFKGYPFAPYEGMTIYQDRNDTNPAVIQGTNTLNIGGTLYFPRNHVEVTGTGGGFGTQLISNTIEIGGTGTIKINYDGRNPFPANKAIIVY